MMCSTVDCSKEALCGFEACRDCINGIPPSIPKESGELRDAALSALRLGGLEAVQSLACPPKPEAQPEQPELVRLPGNYDALECALRALVEAYGFKTVRDALDCVADDLED